LSAASCGGSDDGGGSGGDAFEGYVNKYADLLAAYNANSAGKTKSAWGEWHYCNYGRGEGRTYSGLSAASCGGSDDGGGSGGDAFEGYVNKYADLLAAYNANSAGQTKSAWGEWHYCNHGRNEGRTYSGLSASSCGGSDDGWPSGNYTYLCYHNECDLFSNRTMRWESSSINVTSTQSVLYDGLAGSWPVNFNLGSSGGITMELFFSENYCGVATPEMWTDGVIRGCRIRINAYHSSLGCGTLASTVIHEVAHCLGFFRHTTDGGLMDAVANNATSANATTWNMVSLLYSLSPGTDIGSKLRIPSRARGHKYSLTNPQKLPPKDYYIPIKD
jgi:hypothetical protein